MSGESSAKSIDFDEVADLYDSYVHVDFDLEFWKQEAIATHGKVLELMCGTGRIGMPLIEAGISYTGLDYCQNQLRQFQNKLAARTREARIVFGDAREFDLHELFDLVFIGFSSLSEVVDNRDKIKVLQRIRAHLNSSGRFTFSLHNPAVRNLSLNQEHVFDMDDGAHTLEFSGRFQPPSSDGIVTGKQHYVIKDRKENTVEHRELDLTFHLIPKDEIEAMLATTGFRVEDVWGDYDRSCSTETSPYLIYRCSLA
jgi:SAM-dependent methyltransferase